jgi:hypothetical protein
MAHESPEDIEDYFKRDIKDVVDQAITMFDILPAKYQIHPKLSEEDLINFAYLTFNDWFKEMHKLRTLIDNHHDELSEETLEHVYWYVIISYCDMLRILNQPDDFFVGSKTSNTPNKAILHYDLGLLVQNLCDQVNIDYKKLPETRQYESRPDTLLGTLQLAILYFKIGLTKKNFINMFDQFLHGDAVFISVFSKGVVSIVTRYLQILNLAKKRQTPRDELIDLLLNKSGFVSAPKDRKLEVVLQQNIREEFDRQLKRVEGDKEIPHTLFVFVDDVVANETTMNIIFEDLEKDYPYDIIKSCFLITDAGKIWIRKEDHTNEILE